MTDDAPQSPAKITADHLQDRELSKAAGAPRGYRRLDGLAWLIERKSINGLQLEAGRRIQDDYQTALAALFPKSSPERTGGVGRAAEVSDKALDASRRWKRAMAVIPPELVTMTALFLFPDFEKRRFSLEHVAKMVKEDKRAISLGVRAALSLLARHYSD